MPTDPLTPEARKALRLLAERYEWPRADLALCQAAHAHAPPAAR
jgi:hypothetical protein